MRKVVAAFLCTALAVSFGCSNNKSAPGGPGAPGSRNPTVTSDTFKINPPSGTTDIQQGHTKEITIGINRGNDFKHNVKLTISTDAKGLTVKPDTAEIKAADSATTQKFTLEAAKDAEPGEHKVMVKGTPDAGTSTETSFNGKVTS